MAAVGLVVRAELRHRWRSWLALVVLVALVGGLVLAATAAGRRTASAFPRFVKAHGYDVFVYGYQPLPGLAGLPHVRSATALEGPLTGDPTCRCAVQLTPADFNVFEMPSDELHHLTKLVSGRWPDPKAADEVLVSFTFVHDLGIHVGSRIRVPFYGPGQEAEAAAATGVPAGATVTFHVVGVEAAESDFPSVGTPSYGIVTTSAFGAAFNSRVLLFEGYAVKLQHGEADAPAFDAAVTGLGAGGTADMSLLASTVEDTIHPQAVGWWALALLAGIAGAAMVAQALSRQSRVEDDTHGAVSALGLQPGQIFFSGVARAAVIGAVGALGAVGVAYALSPLAPVGEARAADPSSGLRFDPWVIGLGALAVLVSVVLMGVWPAWRDSRGRVGVQEAELHRPSMVVNRLAEAGAPASAVVGVRRALERGSGRSAVPVGSALAGTAVAVAALCATAVFGSSLLNLTATPRLYGQAFGVWFRNFPDQASAEQVVSTLERDPRVDAVTFGVQGPVQVDGVSTTLLAGESRRGPLVLSAPTGRMPAHDGEIALGAKTMRQAGAHIGSTVELTIPQPGGGAHHGSFRVVGTASFPPDFGIVGFDTGAIVTVHGFVDAQCSAGPTYAACRQALVQNPAVMAGMQPGPSGHADALRYARLYPATAALPVKPTELVNFGEAVNFPLILGVVLVLFGAATLIHVLVVSVARRRRELGLLKAIGFVRRQVAAAVCWQATTVAAVGIVVGVPLGLIAGRLIWHAFATNLGVVPVVVFPVGAIVLLGAGVVLMANVLAAGPALVSARARAGVLLRTE